MKEITIIAGKEIKDAMRSKVFLVIMGLLLLLSVVSIILGTIQVRASMADYIKSVDFLKSIGKKVFPPAPNVNPISISKGFVNYIGMIGALMAIVLGNNAIVREKRNGTLKLTLSRPIFRDVFLNGKLLGNISLLAAVVALVALLTYIALPLIGHASLKPDETLRMLLFFLMSFLYTCFFLVLSMTVSILSRNSNKAILISVIFWLVFAFILPQIGDTMDMDNQLPGGFFAQMGMNRDQEKQVLEHFKFYETLRDSIEEMSPTKHYERMSFALLGVKPGFENNTALEIVGMKWINLVGLTIPSLLLSLIAYMAFLKREDIY